jgi:hypothetical protein
VAIAIIIVCAPSPPAYSQAFETKNALAGQRSSLTGSSGGLSALTANVPGFGRLIDGIQRKKGRESMVIAVVIGVLLCFVIWCVRRT